MKSTQRQVWSVGQVAERFGVATHVLRHWESEGLLSPARAAGERRCYEVADLHRVAVILRAKEAGLGLADIRNLLHAGGPATRAAILREHRADLARRVAALRESLALIECALDCEHEDLVTCSHFLAHVAQRSGLDLDGAAE